MMRDAKSLIRTTLAAVGLEVKRTPQRREQAALRQYWRNGAIPWSTGYGRAKQQLIERTLADAGLLETFRTGGALPANYGIGFDERCVEYPWLFSRLASLPGTLLDAGSALNHAHVLSHAPFALNQLHVLTLAPEPNCFSADGISYLYADLRDIPVRDAYYDAIACISTLEHVGCDNSASSDLPAHRERHLDDFTVAIREMRRTLKPGATLYVTVPYGRYQDHGTFQQFDAAMLTRMVHAFGASRESETTFFRYTSQGWNLATQMECAECEFTDWVLRQWRGEAAAEVVVDPGSFGGIPGGGLRAPGEGVSDPAGVTTAGAALAAP